MVKLGSNAYLVIHIIEVINASRRIAVGAFLRSCKSATDTISPTAFSSSITARVVCVR